MHTHPSELGGLVLLSGRLNGSLLVHPHVIRQQRSMHLSNAAVYFPSIIMGSRKRTPQSARGLLTTPRGVGYSFVFIARCIHTYVTTHNIPAHADDRKEEEDNKGPCTSRVELRQPGSPYISCACKP